MSTQGSPDCAGDYVELPPVVPFEVSPLTRMSCDLGERVVGDEDATLRGEWRYTEGSWRLSMFDVTAHTAVIRVRTPVGRQQFYGAAQVDLESVRPELDAATRWQRSA